jgi:hypothetical protein
MEPRNSERLESWKEIAAFITRDERTAMRWAKFHGMPVHHAPGGSHARVFAYRSEVLEWFRLQDHMDRETSHSAPATSGHAGPPVQAQPEPLPRVAIETDSTISPPVSTPKPDLFSFLRKREWLVVVGIALFAALLMLGELLALRWSNR